MFTDQVTRGCEEAVEETRVVRWGLERSRNVMVGMVEEVERSEELEELPLPQLLELAKDSKAPGATFLTALKLDKKYFI